MILCWFKRSKTEYVFVRNNYIQNQTKLLARIEKIGFQWNPRKSYPVLADQSSCRKQLLLSCWDSCWSCCVPLLREAHSMLRCHARALQSFIRKLSICKFNANLLEMQSYRTGLVDVSPVNPILSGRKFGNRQQTRLRFKVLTIEHIL